MDFNFYRNKFKTILITLYGACITRFYEFGSSYLKLKTAIYLRHKKWFNVMYNVMYLYTIILSLVL
jgi:hypothetical protein